MVGHQDPVAGAIDHCFEQRACLFAARHAQDAGREREQQENPNRSQRRQNSEDVMLRMGVAREQKPCCSKHQHQCNEEHETDAAARLVQRGPVHRRGSIGGRPLHGRL